VSPTAVRLSATVKIEYPLDLRPDGVEGPWTDARGGDAGLFDEVTVGLDHHGVRRKAQIYDRERLTPPAPDAPGKRVTVECGMPVKRALHRARGHGRDAFGQGSSQGLPPRSAGEAFDDAQHVFEPSFAQ
jgi:hypothetical protein